MRYIVLSKRRRLWCLTNPHLVVHCNWGQVLVGMHRSGSANQGWCVLYGWVEAGGGGFGGRGKRKGDTGVAACLQAAGHGSAAGLL